MNKIEYQKRLTFSAMRTVIIIGIFFFGGCSESIDKTEERSEYVWLSEGEIRQIVSRADSATILMTTISSQKRSDGADVFPIIWKNGTQSGDTSYYYIHDGFFINTRLTPNTDSINPFNEQRIAKTSPLGGESWVVIPGQSDTTRMAAQYFDERKTFAGTFRSVFAFTLSSRYDTIVTPFYARGIGFIGADWDRDLEIEYSISYLRTEGKQIGSLFPAKDFRITPDPSTPLRRHILEYALLGRHNASHRRTGN